MRTKTVRIDKTKHNEVPKEGIFIFKNSRGYGFRFKQNKFILAAAQGYNTKAAAKKGIRAIARMCKSNFLILEQDLPVIDLTKSKSTTKKKK